MKKSLYVFWVLLVCILFLDACKGENKTQIKALEKVTIAYPRTSYSLPFQIALKEGFFSSEGLDLDIQLYEYGRAALQSILDGKAHIALSGSTPAMFAIVAGYPISIIAAITIPKESKAIVARKDLGIKIPGDLKGKRIGATLGTTGHFFLEFFLSNHGIEKDNVTVIDLSPDKMMDALTKGEVDAVAAWSPLSTQLKKQLGDNGVLFYEESTRIEPVCISTLQEFTQKRPETIKKVLRALIKAESFIKEKPEKAKNLATDFFKVDRDTVDKMWSAVDFRVELDLSLLEHLEDQSRWAQTGKYINITETPHYLNNIYFEGLQPVKP